ncbi:MAG: SBBP repeat-containing protein [Acidobacteriales bacterium]|nr:SBBP repeat-containing protein [Terriglobales bacterium]
MHLLKAACFAILVTGLGSAAPTLRYSTYLGGIGDEAIAKIAVDATGNIYVTGSTNSVNFPVTAGAVQSKPGGKMDAFVAKLDPSGVIVYCTYLGGSGVDRATDLAVDAQGNTYITGITTSTDFPTTAGVLRTTSTGGTFVAKLNPNGTALLYSTYLDTVGAEAYGIAIDKAGRAFVTGTTYSSSFPTTPGAFQRVAKSNDAFVAKLNAEGTNLVYATLVGGDSGDEASRIAVDEAGNAYVAGGTRSLNFPITSGAFQKEKGAGTSEDAFVFKLNPDGGGLVYSTYLGGSGPEGVYDMTTDTAGNVCATGITYSGDFPVTPSALQKTYGGNGDAFAAKLNMNGSALLYATYLGGTRLDSGGGISVGPRGEAYITGVAAEGFPVTADAVQAVPRGYTDAFLVQLDVDGAVLKFSTFLGGGDNDSGSTVTVDSAGNIYLAGGTLSHDFPVTAGAFQKAFGGGTNGDAFIAVIGVPVEVKPQITAAGIGNAANYVAGKVSPGEIIVIFGKDFGPATLAGLQLVNGMVATETGETRVLFDGLAAPMVYAASGQVSCVVPYEVASRTTTQVVVEHKKVKSAAVAVPVVEAVPGLFSINASGTGPGAFLNEDTSVNSPANPLERGKIAVFYGTGEGQTTPAGVSGLPAMATFPKPVLPVTVTIGGKSAEVLYAAAAPYMVAGVIQINARVPADTPVGNAEVIIKAGNNPSQGGITLAVK